MKMNRMQKIVGVDIGTMNILSAQQVTEGKLEIKRMRDMFLPVDPEYLTATEISNTSLDYAESRDEEGEVDKIFILGEDSYKFANIFGQKVRRPISNGVISSKEIDAQDVLALMMEKLIGKTKDGYCVYSVPAQAIDSQIPPVLYHERVFGSIFSSLGYSSKSINEGMAIIFAECQRTNFSGIGISFGAGLTNVACAYKGTPTLTFSVSRAGDWVDSETASSLGILSTRVTAIKEKYLDFTKLAEVKKKEKRVLEALNYYYKNLVSYILKIISLKFEESSEGLQIDEKIPIIVSGGTSKPAGFIDLFNEVFSEHKNFPYEISEVKQASDPLTAVVKGCLIYALWEKREELKKEAK